MQSHSVISLQSAIPLSDRTAQRRDDALPWAIRFDPVVRNNRVLAKLGLGLGDVAIQTVDPPPGNATHLWH